MLYGLVHTAVIFIVLVLFFRQLDFSGANPVTAVTFMLLGSFSFVGIGMIAAILPLLYVERGAQMTFVLQSCMLLVSGVYYSVAVLPDWMQVLSRLSPATYVLDGRARRTGRRHAGDRAHARHLAAASWPASCSSRSGCGRSAGPSGMPSAPASSRGSA